MGYSNSNHSFCTLLVKSWIRSFKIQTVDCLFFLFWLQIPCFGSCRLTGLALNLHIYIYMYCDVCDSTIWLVCTVSCKLPKSCMAMVPGLFSCAINRCGSTRLEYNSLAGLKTKGLFQFNWHTLTEYSFVNEIFHFVPALIALFPFWLHHSL